MQTLDGLKILLCFTIALPYCTAHVFDPCEGRGQQRGVFCGRGLNHQDCSSGYECINDPTDRFAVCCRIRCAVPLCLKPCPNGYENDENGCQTCNCKVPICLLKPFKGPCQAIFWRYYYDANSGTCKKFIYGGCGANGNKFLTWIDCMKTCFGICPSGIPVFNCLADPCSVTKCTKFPKAECRSNFCGGCNAKFFVGKRDVTKKCKDRCELPKDSGPCEAAIPRWFYNTATKECEKFLWGGCKGNANKFKNEKGCRKRCKGEKPGVCPSAKLKIGTCVEECSKDKPDCPGKQKCCSNGCGHTCQNPMTPSELCVLPMDVGPCRGSFKRFFYDAKLGKCKKFTYGGCKGNANRFETKAKCTRFCKGVRPPCPPNKPEVNCKVDPCQVQKCPLFPKAKCISNFCGGCNAKFFWRGNDVTMRCKGLCPPPSGMPGICVFRPGINCLADKECKPGRKCCPEGCGKVCKKPIFD